MCAVADSIGNADLLPISFALGRIAQIEVVGKEAAFAPSLYEGEPDSDHDQATEYVEQQIHALKLCFLDRKNKGVARC